MAKGIWAQTRSRQNMRNQWADGGSSSSSQNLTSQFHRNQLRPHPVAPSSLQHQPEEAKWLETSTIRQQNITRMLPNPTALLPKIMAKATMQRAKNIHPTPSNTPRMLDSPASKPTTRANSKSKLLGPTQVGPYYCPLAVRKLSHFSSQISSATIGASRPSGRRCRKAKCMRDAGLPKRILCAPFFWR